MNIRALSGNQEIPKPNHVIVVRLGHQRFEVSGTAGYGRSDASYLRPLVFEQQDDAISRAKEFAASHALGTIYVKGFQPRTG